MVSLTGNIETANALPLDEFRTRYLPITSSAPPSVALLTTPNALYRVTIETSSTIEPVDISQCFDLIAETSSSAYAASSKGWSPSKKRKEMRLPELRYLLVRKEPPSASSVSPATLIPTSTIDGFLSFMLTYEDCHAVIYCYEIHLKHHLRGLGIGKGLMKMMEEVGRKVGVEKAMLTVFLENEPALKLYHKLEYEEDDYSPKARKLRGGVLKLPTYVILSKKLSH